MAPPKITLYTNHLCPFAQRAHITLKELGLQYDEVIIDLTKPREPWYLEVNPRGLVPSIKYSNDVLKDEIITESAIVAQFLVDEHPSHLLPAPGSSPTAALFRARVNFFIDTWNTKMGSYMYKISLAASDEEKKAAAEEAISTLAKEIDPLLKGAAPFFGGSDKLTLADIHAAPFVLRFYALSKAGAWPSFVTAKLDELPNFSKWAAALKAHESVTEVFPEETFVNHFTKRIEERRAAAKA